LYKIQADAGDRIIVDIDAIVSGSFLDSILRLFDSEGNELTGSAFGNPDPFISFNATTSDTYYIGVSGVDNFSYNPFVEGNGFGFSTGTASVLLLLLLK
jgi:serralysin